MSEQPLPGSFADARAEVLEVAADRACLAPSVHNTQPWTLQLTEGHLAFRADRSRQLMTLDPLGRALVISVGAALLNARVAVAARGWAMEVRRLPDADDPDLLAELQAEVGRPESELAGLDRLIRRRHTNRRRFGREALTDELRARLETVAAEEGATLFSVDADDDRRLVARLTQEADQVQNADPAYRAELGHWTTRPATAGDGVPAGAVAQADEHRHDEPPLRNFDTTGTGRLPSGTASDSRQSMLVVATPGDRPLDWRSRSYSARPGCPSRRRPDRSPAARAHPNAVLRLIPSSAAETVTLPVRSNEARNSALAFARSPDSLDVS